MNQLKQKIKLVFKRCLQVLATSKRVKLIFICLVIVIAGLFSGFYVYQNNLATSRLKAAKNLDGNKEYAAAKKTLDSINTVLVRGSTKKQIRSELKRNQQLAVVQQKLEEVQKLLSEHKTQAAQDLLKQLTTSANGASTDATNQIASLQKAATQQPSSTKPSSGGSSTGSGGGTTGGGSGSSGGTGGSSGGSSGGGGGGSGPNTGPLTSFNVVSFNASTSGGTASTCNISGSLTFGADGSGSVIVTWSQYSTKTVSQTDNPDHFSFAAAGTQSDSFNFGGSQGLEPGDSYRILATITSVSNPGISITAGPVTLASCAAPPALAAEQQSPFMTAITPGTPSIYQYQDGVFSNECSVQVSTPYSVNAGGTVQAIVLVTSGGSIGYTYYDKSGATGFTGSGSATDTSYFRLPHLPGGGHYTIQVKLVEVSNPGTVYAYTSSLASNCD